MTYYQKEGQMDLSDRIAIETPSNRDGIELQRNCSNKKPQNAITVMYLFIIDIPPRILANVNCPHSAIGISRVSPFQGRT